MKKLFVALVCASVFSAGAASLNLQSRSAIVVDRDTGATLYAKEAQDVAPIASVTKLMTAMVVLDEAPDMNEILTITQDDVDTLKNSSSRLAVGTQLPRHELLHLALMSSENRAAHALARHTSRGSLDEFVRAMNAKARELGMSEARFVDPTGLSPRNQATARDLARLADAAARYPAIRDYSSRTSEMVEVGGTTLPYKNTNHLVGRKGWDVLLSKTGYIREAGRCIVMNFTAAGRNLAVVLLGADSSAARERDLLKVRSWVSGEQEPPVAARVLSGKHRSKALAAKAVGKKSRPMIHLVAQKKKQGTRGALWESGRTNQKAAKAKR